LPAGGRFAAYRFLTNLPGLGTAGVVHASASTNLRDHSRKRMAKGRKVDTLLMCNRLRNEDKKPFER